MSSGYGLSGGPWNPRTIHPFHHLPAAVANPPPGPSRCFPFWQELLACYVMNTESEDTSGAQKCLPALEDYYECLHHRKEVCPFALPASLT